LLSELSDESEPAKTVVVVGHPAIHIALMGHCLNLTKEWMGLFHLDAGSISVIDFPDGPTERGVIRCINYTAHLGRWSIPITRSIVDDEAF
jgi:broad specificity phosphatase PhoE